MSSPTRPASHEEQTTRIASVEELRMLAAWLPVWSNAVLIQNLADTLDALREAWIGCGEEIGPRGLKCCGDWRHSNAPARDQLGKRHCPECSEKLSAAISTLTGVTTHE